MELFELIKYYLIYKLLGFLIIIRNTILNNKMVRMVFLWLENFDYLIRLSFNTSVLFFCSSIAKYIPDENELASHEIFFFPIE